MPSYLEIMIASSNALVVHSEEVYDGVGFQVPSEIIEELNRMGFIIGNDFICCPCCDKQKKASPKITYPDEVKFTFIGDRENANHHGIITIASLVDGKNVFYGCAYCNPADRFNKEVGKKLAYDRLRENMYMVVIPKKQNKFINRAILCDIIANNDHPSWADDIIKGALVGYFWG